VRARAPLDAAKVGSAGYMAPEVAALHVEKPLPKDAYRFPVKFQVGLAADMWSLGAVAYEIITGMKLIPPDEATCMSPAKQGDHQLSHQMKELKMLVGQLAYLQTLCKRLTPT
jgi:serine/threonine protein kinase